MGGRGDTEAVMHAGKSVLAYLEEGARSYPQRCAVVDAEGECSYAELRMRSRKAGSALANRGVRRRAVVVYMEKSIDALSAMLGALYAGGFYVPVDPRAPVQRLSRICDALGDPLVVADANLVSRAQQAAGESRTVSFEELRDVEANDHALSQARRGVTDADAAYVLFTSGSTGVPKGVAVSHRSVVDFIDSFVELFGIESDDRIGNQAPFDFDVSVKDIYGSLAAGATLVVIPRALFSQPAALATFLNDQRVTVMTWAVAALCLMTSLHALDGEGLPHVRKVLFSGEVMPHEHLKAWMERLPRALFANLYGPTEVTCNCTYHVIDRSRDYAEGIPLGSSFPNREVLLVGDDGREVTQPGGVGEIYVRGTSLALGYVGDEGATAAAFVQNPLHARYPDRAYKTGDLGRLNDAGELFYCGRTDNQVKYLGHRIALEEIDRALEEQQGVSRCRCAYDDARKRIVAFYEGTALPASLLEGARASLPPQMIPTKLVQVESMPLTKNGKVDRRALLEDLARSRGKKRRLAV